MRLLEEKIRSELMNNSSLNMTLTNIKKGYLTQDEEDPQKEVKRLRRELEKCRSKVVIKSNENDNLKQLYDDGKKKLVQVVAENELYTEKIHKLKKEIAKLQNDRKSEMSCSVTYLQQDYAELKQKYNNLKYKCIEMNKENEFYN